MKSILALLFAVAGTCSAACREPAPPSVPIAIPAVDNAAVIPAAGSGVRGKVEQVLDGGGYTFAEVTDAAGARVWIAVRRVPIDVGDEVEYPATEATLNFESKPLGRTFERVLLVRSIRVMK